MSLIIPPHYRAKLSPETTEQAIKIIKQDFQTRLSKALHLRRVTAPLFVLAGSGINDDLNGVERPVSFAVKSLDDRRAEVVHSLAKWKRLKLKAYDIAPGYGLYTDMNAIRADEELDNLHSLYVDQWDWEKTITDDDRTEGFLQSTVNDIYQAIRATEQTVYDAFPHITPRLPEKIVFVHAQELLDRYPGVSPQQREALAAKEHGAIFVTGIGGQLSDGSLHDLRAPDYDDWSTPTGNGRQGLNGDIIFWDRVLERPIEVSSMGIRVDPRSLVRQLEIRGCTDRLSLDFHKKLAEGSLPQSIGGGIGQSRLCMFLLQKAHIGEVQASLWPESQIEACAKAGIELM